MKIQVTFPVSIKPETIKTIIEGNMKQNSQYECSVEFGGFEDGENVFFISADRVEAFYLIGMTASQIIDRFA